MTDRSDAREQLGDLEEMLRVAIDSVLAGKFGSLPVEAVEDSQDGNTVKLKATVKIPVQGPDGETQWMELPEFHDVLAQHPGANGITHTYPVKKGDTGTISFQGLGYDNWHQSGGVQNAVTMRSALSDGVFRPGGRAIPQKLKGVSKDSIQTRTDDKKSVVDVSHSAITTTRTNDQGETSLHRADDSQVVASRGDSMSVVKSDGVLHRKSGSEIQVVAQAISKVAPQVFINC